MLSEKDFEDIICKYPELIEDDLVLKGRQITLYGRRMDILFEDKFKRKLIIELKAGPIKDEHIGQLLSYEGMLLSAEDPTVRIMLVGNRVPPNIQKSLDHHGIGWKEITLSYLKGFLEMKKNTNFLKLFDFDVETFNYKKGLPTAEPKGEIGDTSRDAIISGGKNYWIFTHVHRNAEENFNRLIKLKNWQSGENKWIHLIKKDDTIVFYVSIKETNIRYFAGEAVITGGAHSPTRPSLSGKGFKYEIDFNNVDIWGTRVYLIDIRDKLNFIKIERNPGLAFKNKAIILINRQDYEIIKISAKS